MTPTLTFCLVPAPSTNSRSSTVKGWISGLALALSADARNTFEVT